MEPDQPTFAWTTGDKIGDISRSGRYNVTDSPEVRTLMEQLGLPGTAPRFDHNVPPGGIGEFVIKTGDDRHLLSGIWSLLIAPRPEGQGYRPNPKFHTFNARSVNRHQFARHLSAIQNGYQRGSHEQHQAKTDEQAEIKRLQKDLKPVTEERDILKKAAVSSTRQRRYALHLLQRCQVAECFPRSFIQLPCKFF